MSKDVGMFDDYLFHASSTGNLMPGAPKVLTKNQQELFDRLDKVRHGIGERLTVKQKELLSTLKPRFNGDGKTLSDKLLLTYNELLKKSVTPVSLGDSQIAIYGDLMLRKNAKCELTDTVKKYLEKKVWEHLTGRSTKLQNRFMDKGNEEEETSLTIYSNFMNRLVMKNTETKQNDYIIGTADIVEEKIRDIKTSWSWATFPLTTDSFPSKTYQWQLDSYMWLWNKDEAELIYCLVDTPHKLIDDELRRLNWRYNIFDITGDVRENKKCIDLVVEVVTGHLYKNKSLEAYCHQSSTLDLDWFVGVFREIPEEIRIKIYDLKRSKLRENQLKEMIILARKYMNEVILKIGDNTLKLQKVLEDSKNGKTVH